MTMNYWRTLVGQSIDAVVFVQDYVQLVTSNGRITFFSFPVLLRDDVTFAHDNSFFPDRLCEELGRKIVSCELAPEVELMISTEVSTLRLSLRPEHRSCVEMVIYQGHDPADWWVL